MSDTTHDNAYTSHAVEETAAIVSRDNPLKHYQWGSHCEGWNLVDTVDLSVKLESMPPGTEESLHYHQHALQFFFILKGSAFFEIEGKLTAINQGQGIHIRPKEKHRIINRSNKELEFILCSQPSTQDDRINIA